MNLLKKAFHKNAEIITIILLIVIAAGCGSSGSGGWKNYSDSKIGVSFNYPSDWIVGDPSTLSMPQPPVIFISAPSQDNNFTSNFNLTIQESPYLAPAAEFTANQTVEYFTNFGESMGSKDFKKMSYQNSQDVSNAGILTFEWTIAQSNQRLKQMQLIVPRGNKTYTMTFSTSPEAWEKYKPIFDKIVSTFQVI